MITIYSAATLISIATMILMLRRITPVRAHEALVLRGAGSSRVAFARTVVLTGHVERIDLRVVPVEIRREGRDSLHCRDQVRLELTAILLVRINATADDVLRAYETLGVRASDDRLRELLGAKLTYALKTALAAVDHTAVTAELSRVRDRVLQELGPNHSGLVIERLAIGQLALAPKSVYDATNILDAEGLRRLLAVDG